MASRRGLGQFADLMLQQYMKQKQARFESSLQADRQKEMADYNAKFTVLGKLINDPELAQRLMNRGMTDVGGFGPSDFIPTPQQKFEAQAKNIAGMSDLQKLPSEQDLRNQEPDFANPITPGGRPPIETLMEQVARRNDVIKGGAAPQRQTTYNPTLGATQERFVNPFNEPGPFQTAPTGAQTGQQAGAQDLAKLQTPGLAQAEIAKTNQVESGTRPGAVARAGAIAGSQAAAQSAVEWNPQTVAKKLDFESKKANANLINQGRLEQMKEINAMTSTMTMLLPRITELKELSKTINVKGKLNVPGRAMTSAAGMLGTDPDAAKMGTLQDSIALGMANSIGGNKGQVSENDKNAMKALLPGPFDSDELADSKLKDLDLMFELLPQVLGQADIADPPAVRIEKARRAMEIYKAAKGLNK